MDTESPQAAVLPGGIQATRRFTAEPRVHTLLRRVVDGQGYVMAINTSCAVLRSREVARGNGPERGRSEKPAMGWHGGDSLLEGLEGLPCERVRVEGRVILSQGSDLAEEAALTLASLLEG